MTQPIQPEIDRIVTYFETISVAALDQLDTAYSDVATFKDPFNDVQGIEAIRAVYAHMFATLDNPRFAVTGRWLAAGSVVLRWDFAADGLRGRRAAPIAFTGLTLLELDAHGRIQAHRDYWDAAEEVYEKVPVLGAMLRLIKRRMRAGHGAGLQASR